MTTYKGKKKLSDKEPQEVALDTEEVDEELVEEELEEEEDEDDDDETEDSEEAGSEEEEAGEEQKKGKSHKKRKLLRRLLNGDEDDDESISDDIQISGKWVKRHWSFLLLLFLCMLVFVTNRYQAQQEIIEEARLKEELQDWKYVWLTQFSELTRTTRQSYIEESLKQRGDSTLKPSKETPFIIKAK